MKSRIVPALLCLLTLAACSEPKKDQIKKRLIEKCVTQASSGPRSPDAKMQGFIKEYCNCTVEKFGDNLSEAQLDSLDQMKDGNPEMMERLAPLVDQCASEVQDKMRGTGSGR